jgi:hypothetical protein
MNEYDLDIDDTQKGENKHMLSFSMENEYQPIQKNTKLFKFILYTSKVEIKMNGLIKLIYTCSLFELSLWALGFLMFLASPKDLYLIWILIFHVFKAVIGLIILRRIPKTYEILENLALNPNFEEDKILDLIDTQIRETFMERWQQNKGKLLCYLISTIISLIIDVVIFIVQIVVFGKNVEYYLMNMALLSIILVFLGKIKH